MTILVMIKTCPLCLTKSTISRRVHVYSFQRGWSSCIRQCHRGSRMWVSLQSSSSLLSSSLSPSSSSCHHHRHYHYHASASVLVQWSMIKTELELLFKRMHLIIKSSQLRIPLHQVHENNQQSEIATRNQSKVRKNIKLQSHHFASLLLQQPPFKFSFSGLSLMPEYSPVNDTPSLLTLSIIRCHLQKYMYLQYM